MCVSQPFHQDTETDPLSEICFLYYFMFLEHWTTDKVQKLRGSKYDILSSQQYRTEVCL
jgi:hypothetical protein